MNENPGGISQEMEEVSPSSKVEGGFWASLIDIFIDPVKVFKRIKAGLPWWQPFIVMSIFTYITAYLMQPVRIIVLRLNEKGHPIEQIEQQIQISEKIRLFEGLIALVIILVAYLIVAALCNVAVNLTSGKSDFKKMLSLLNWTGLIGAVFSALRFVVIYIKGFDSIESRVDALVGFGLTDLPSFRYMEGTWRALLDSTLTIPMIWYFILFIVGVTVIYKTSKLAALAPAAIIWLLSFGLIILREVGGGI